MKNNIKNSKITLISGLITATTVIALFVMPFTAMASGRTYGNYGDKGGYSGGSSYYSDSPSYYPTQSAPVSNSNSNANANANSNTNTNSNTNNNVITINNVVSGGYSAPAPTYTQPIVYQQQYQQPIYSAPAPVYSYNYQPPTYYQDYNYAAPMVISCTANTSFAPVGTMVLWTASVSGGNGYYTYQWSGSDQIYGSNSSADVSYNTPGQKYAAVSVYSGGQTLTVNCSNIVTVGVPNYNNGVTPAAPAPVVHYVTRTVVRTVPVVTAATSTTNLAANSVFSLSNIPWGWVAFLIILVLFATILYLLFNKNKI